MLIDVGFLSFDALFSKIVPEAERDRLADLRSKTDVAAIVNKMQDATAQSRRQAARELLWGEEWLGFEEKLKQVRVAIHRVPQVATAKIAELRESELAEQRANDKALADLKIGKAEIERERQRVAARLEQARERSTQLRTELTKLGKAVFEIEREIVEKTAEADAEERGIGATSVRGRGPEFAGCRVRSSGSRKKRRMWNCAVTATASAAPKASMPSVSSRKKSPPWRSASSSSTAASDNSAQIPTRAPKAFRCRASNARSNNSTPTWRPAACASSRTRRGKCSTRCRNQCAKGAGFVASFDSPTNTLEGNACSTASLQAAAARLFALNEAKTALAQKCVSTNAALINATVEGRLSFVRDCLNLSGLLPSEAKSIASDINALERERDDQAHRFRRDVQCLPRRQQLAFLALGIAAAVDVLVLASGLLGATAIRSSLAGRGLRNDLRPLNASS